MKKLIVLTAILAITAIGCNNNNPVQLMKEDITKDLILCQSIADNLNKFEAIADTSFKLIEEKDVQFLRMMANQNYDVESLSEIFLSTLQQKIALISLEKRYEEFSSQDSTKYAPISNEDPLFSEIRTIKDGEKIEDYRAYLGEVFLSEADRKLSILGWED